jgi:hypothetical protein
MYTQNYTEHTYTLSGVYWGIFPWLYAPGYELVSIYALGYALGQIFWNGLYSIHTGTNMVHVRVVPGTTNVVPRAS